MTGGSARLALRAIFGLQLGIAAVLVGRDFAAVAPTLQLPSFAPPVDTPISPGDQTRRFDPSKLPPRPSAPDRPGAPLPATTDMPSRLFFEDTDGGVTLHGTIKEGDADRFAEWLEAQDPLPERLWMDSPGGSVGDALAIGRLIRAQELPTGMQAGTVCLSACPYMLMGGTERVVDATAWVGVHQHYYGENIVQPAFMAVEDIQRSQAGVITYLDDMGISPLVMRHSLATPPDEIYILVAEELTEYGVATELTGADD